MDRLVVALGGNALLRAGEATVASQLDRIRETARHVVNVLEAGHEVVLTHGNGPQVGNRILQQEAAEGTPSMPLDVLVAETQAQIGYLLQQALDNQLRTFDDERTTDFVTIVTQVVVDGDDPAFEEPTKPVGPAYTESEAESRDFETRAVGSGERSYRRVVPSPTPTDIVELEEIAATIEAGTHVVCAGGGGVPVVNGGGYDGVEAVVDKDRTSALLAAELDADALVVLTDVGHVYREYGTDDQEPIRSLSTADAKSLLEAGTLDAGSMQPKVEACHSFVERSGGRAVITRPDRLEAGLAGQTGTQFGE